MSADVTVVENSLTSSIDMLIRNPIALFGLFCHSVFGKLANDAFCYLYFTSDRLDNGGLSAGS